MIQQWRSYHFPQCGKIFLVKVQLLKNTISNSTKFFSLIRCSSKGDSRQALIAKSIGYAMQSVLIIFLYTDKIVIA